MAQVCSESFECKVPAKRMWCGVFQDAHNCLPKAMPHKIAAVEYPEGHGCVPGSVRTIKFHQGGGLGQTVEKGVDDAQKFLQHEVLLIKEKIEEVDHEAFKIKVAVIEGGLLGVLFKHYKHTFEIKEGAPHAAGCIVHWTTEFEALTHHLHELTETFKGVEAHHSLAELKERAERPLKGAESPHYLDELKEHIMEPFKGVEAYLLEHDDYAC